jgi:hypothetical protein
MKKLLLVLAAMCIVAVSNAQISFGPKIGVNLSSMTASPGVAISDQMKAGYDLGAFLRIGTKCYFQPELLYSTSGVKFSNAPIGAPTDISLHNINVPLMFGARILNLKVANVRVLGGPVATFLVDKSVNYNGFVDETKAINIKDSKWGLQVGAGVDVLMFSLDVRYNFDFNKQITQNKSVTQQVSDFDWSKQAVTVSLGWKLF